MHHQPTFGIWLRQRRKALDLTQAQLAQQAGCSLSAIRQFERSVVELREMGVNVLYGEGGFVPNEPGQGRPGEYPWGLLLDAAERLVPRA